MHDTQKALLQISENQNLGSMSLRNIAKLIGLDGKPELIKHHLEKLKKSGLMNVDLKSGVIKPARRGFCPHSDGNIFYSIPVVSPIGCTIDNIFSKERTIGYLKISVNLLPKEKESLHIIIAPDSSMNLCEIREGVTIDKGDFVLIDDSYKNPEYLDIVVSVIGSIAAIRRYEHNKNDGVLTPESTDFFYPTYFHEDDLIVSGKVIDVFKK